MSEALGTVRELLETDLDEWTRRVVRRHFHPATGSPYWLKRAATLAFEPRDITRHSELAQFGPFDLGELRTLDPADLVPSDLPRPLVGRVFDSGGTTGDPCRVYYTERMLHHRAAWRGWSFAKEGFEPGRPWLQATPSGPHLIGNGAFELIQYAQALVYQIDIDPRWVKELIRAGRLDDADEYTDHVVDQIVRVMRQQRIEYMNTTPAIFQALVRGAPEAAASLRGVRMSGTQITPAMYRSFTAALDGGILGRTYGNTFGTCCGLPAEQDGEIMPYAPNYPQVTVAVVDKDDWTRPVGYGDLGQVMLTVMHEDLFLPNILERDQARSYRTGADWPCDGVANVQPLQISRSTPEGIY